MTIESAAEAVISTIPNYLSIATVTHAASMFMQPFKKLKEKSKEKINWL